MFGLLADAGCPDFVCCYFRALDAVKHLGVLDGIPDSRPRSKAAGSLPFWTGYRLVRSVEVYGYEIGPGANLDELAI